MQAVRGRKEVEVTTTHPDTTVADITMEVDTTMEEDTMEAEMTEAVEEMIKHVQQFATHACTRKSRSRSQALHFSYGAIHHNSIIPLQSQKSIS